MWIFVKTYHNFSMNRETFPNLILCLMKSLEWIIGYAYRFGNVLMVWEMFWVELNWGKRVFELKCHFKWLREISYVLAIKLELFELKMMCYFSVLIHIFAGTCFACSIFRFLKWFETCIWDVFGFENNWKMYFLWRKVNTWLVYNSNALRWSM